MTKKKYQTPRLLTLHIASETIICGSTDYSASPSKPSAGSSESGGPSSSGIGQPLWGD